MSQAKRTIWIDPAVASVDPRLTAILAEHFDVIETAPESPGLGADVVLGSPVVASPLAAQRERLLDALGDGICMTSGDGTPIWMNRAFADFETEVKERVIAAAADAARMFGGKNGPRVRRLDVVCSGTDRTSEVVITPVDGQPAQPAGTDSPEAESSADVVAIVRDVTAARRLARKVDAIDAAGSALVRLDAESVRKMDAMARVALLEEKIVRGFKELLDYDHFLIRLTDERTGRLEPVMSTGIPEESIQLELYPQIEGNGIVGYVAATGRDYICYDASRDERFLPGASGACSSLTVPLRIDDEIIGVLDIESQEVGAFTEEDRRIAAIFARYIAIALKMLDLLVVERSATNETVSDRFAGEISEPLEDILREASELALEHDDPEAIRHIEQIRKDVESIRNRVKDTSTGRHTLLGLDRVETDRLDPLLAGRRMLVVDDDPKILGIIADVLRRRGCDVRTSSTGEQAIAAISAQPESERPFDVVVSDISLPDRNGYEVFSAARATSTQTAVILMTGFGYDPHHSIVRASQQGLQSVLFKPFQALRLLEEIRAAVERHNQPQA